VRRATFDEVGLFDERFGHGNFEDDDFCLRLRLHGYRLVIARRAFLHHEGHATFRALGLSIVEQIEQRRAQFVAKWQQDPAGRAVIAAMRGDVQEAAAQARAAQRIWPRWPDADLHLARLAGSVGDHAVAIDHFTALLRACPAHSDAAFGLSLHLLAAGRTDAALRQLGWTVAHCELSEERQIHLLRLLGELAHRRGQWAEAAANFGAAAELRPDDGELHNWCGVCRLELGDIAGARQAFEAAIAADFPLAYTNRGICRHRQGDVAGALADFGSALARLPNDPVAQRNHAALAQQIAAAECRPCVLT
jgi:tetratricopeptide (TPR) repeat protein